MIHRHRLALAGILLLSGFRAASEAQTRPAPRVPDLLATPTVTGWRLREPKLLAYEEHRHFTYVVARVLPREGGAASDSDPSRRLIRRFLLLKPSTVLLDDLIASEGDRDRKVQVLHTFPDGATSAASRAEMARKGDGLELTLRDDGRVCRLALPPADRGAGEIAIAEADGAVLLARRPLTSGVLPAGAGGMRLLEQWDARYRQEGRAPWDIGRPSRELVKAVGEGELRPCRAVVLGCGTGTNAVYLASQGFDVTGIDIAPTALTRAGEKAEKAGVRVRWVLADVTNPPEVEPFDLVYDRGCYHGVRRQNAVRYVASLRRLTRPGARILILAGNANEERRYGPPRVKEEEIRGDFSADFDFQWLRETHFETRTPGEEGALAWSILLRRKEAP